MMVADEQIAKEAKSIFSKELGLQIHTGVAIESVKVTKNKITLRYTNADKQKQTLEVDKLIVAIGRIPNTAGLGADKNGLALDERGLCWCVTARLQRR